MATKTLFVGNLPYGITDSELRNHFAAYNATNVRLVEGRGFGFVDIDDALALTVIYEMHKSELNGRAINVNEAHPKGSAGGSRSDRYHAGTTS